MRRTRRSRQRKAGSGGRLILLAAGGLLTVLALIVVLISLEARSPSQHPPSAPPTDTPGPPAGRIHSADRPAAPDESYTFFETLPQLQKTSPGLTSPARGPGEGPAPGNPPASAGRAARSPRFTVQVAATQNRSAAQGLADKLMRKGYPAFVLEPADPENGWYRVRIGHFSDRGETQALADRVAKQEGLRSFVATE